MNKSRSRSTIYNLNFIKICVHCELWGFILRSTIYTQNKQIYKYFLKYQNTIYKSQLYTIRAKYGPNLQFKQNCRKLTNLPPPEKNGSAWTLCSPAEKPSFPNCRWRKLLWHNSKASKFVTTIINYQCRFWKLECLHKIQTWSSQFKCLTSWKRYSIWNQHFI